MLSILYLASYQRAVNKIDDYFEFRYTSDQDKEAVLRVLRELTEELNKHKREAK